MTIHLHHLTSCTPAPLSQYLKAVGVLRLISEQADPDVRGWWQDEHFCLLTKLDRAALIRFFLEDYAPSPVFNPWGARSGYYPGSSESAARKALLKIELSKLSRLEPFRNAIATIRTVVLDRSKPESDEATGDMLNKLRLNLRGAGGEWLDTVRVLVGGNYRAPAILGTGGNEGSGSYCSAFMAAVAACIIDRSMDASLDLFTDTNDRPIPKDTWKGSFGQFAPNGDGSAWDFLLAIEGAIIFRSTVTRTTSGMGRFLASPFYFAPRAAGTGSSSVFDEVVVNKGRVGPGRGEQWFPLWSIPVSADEIKSLIAEGRCSLGRTQSAQSLEAARAIGHLGIARGIDSFGRFGYLQRNNLSTHFAIPLARIIVRGGRHVRLIDDLGAWIDRVHMATRRKHAPARLVSAERELANATYALLTHDGAPLRLQALLRAALSIEEIQVYGGAVQAGPIPPLSPEWLIAADDGTAEWRLAVALGSAAAEYDRRRRPIDSVRHHWLPLRRGARRFYEQEKRLVRDPRVVMSGREPITDCIAVVERRMIEAAQRGNRRLSLVSAGGCGAQPSDLKQLIAGEVDLARVVSLARALMAVRWDQVNRVSRTVSWRSDEAWPDEPWMALRLSHLALPLSSERSIPGDEAIIRRLSAGDGISAVDLATRRLSARGLRPPFRATIVDHGTARLWGAALAFPIDQATARAMARRFESVNHQENR